MPAATRSVEVFDDEEPEADQSPAVGPQAPPYLKVCEANGPHEMNKITYVHAEAYGDILHGHEHTRM